MIPSRRRRIRSQPDLNPSHICVGQRRTGRLLRHTRRITARRAPNPACTLVILGSGDNSLRSADSLFRSDEASFRSGKTVQNHSDSFFEILMRVVPLFEVRVKKLAHSLRFPFLARDHTGTLEVNSNIDRRRTGGCPAQQRVCLMKATIRRTIEMSNGC